MKTIIKIALFIPAIWLVSCNNNKEQEPDTTQGNETVISKEKLDHSGITYGTFSKKVLASEIPAKGKVINKPDATASVNSVLPGIVKTIHVQVGDKVQQGSTLATLSGNEFINLQEKYLNAIADLNYWEKEYQRQKTLQEDNINAKKIFEETSANFLKAKASKASAESRLKLLGIKPEQLMNGQILDNFTLKSPINGIVNKINAHLGMQTENAIELFEIVDNSSLLIELNVFEKDIPFIKKGQQVRLNLIQGRRNKFNGEITAIAGAINDEVKVVKTIVSFTNDLDLIPGMFVSGLIQAGQDTVFALKEESIIIDSDSEKFIYYTIDDPASGKDIQFVKVPVKTGSSKGNWVQVTPLENIPENAKIVLTGSYYIHSAELQKE